MFISLYPSSGSGGGVTKYNTVTDLPLTATDGDLAITIDTDTLYIYTGSAWVPIASPSTAFGRAGHINLGSGIQSQAVVFSSVLPSTNYSVLSGFVNTVDADPIFLEVVAIARSTSGFTVHFNAPTDSVNYVYTYTCIEDI